MVELQSKQLRASGLPLSIPARTASELSEGERLSLVIELAFADLFAPYDLKVDRDDLSAALRDIAILDLDITSQAIDEIENLRHEVLKQPINRTHLLIGIGVGGLVLVATGLLAAPLIGTSIGAAAGLSGTAATLSGLATLGCGAVAAGGFGVMGGLWVIAGSAAVVGGAIGGSTALCSRWEARRRRSN